MKNTIILTACVFFAACSATPDDPAAKLTALKEQKAAIEAEIRQLEDAHGLGVEQRLRTIALTELQPTQFLHSVDLQGRVEADKSVLATSRMPGTLTRIYVDNGDRVSKGQLMAELDNAVMLKSLAELQGQLDVATDLFQRQKSLWDQNIGSEVQYIQAKNNKESIERSIATLNENLGLAKIYAPTSGIVDQVILKEGQAIAPGVALCTIVNLDKLKIKGDVTESYVSKIKEGDPVKVYFPDTGEEINTKVSYVSRTINPVNRTFTIECKLNGKGDYRANQIAVMKIVDYANPKAIVIPVNLLQRGEDGIFVLIGKPTENPGEVIAEKAMVTQGENYNGNVEITSGLSAGDKVISTGFQDINPGEIVLYK